MQVLTSDDIKKLGNKLIKPFEEDCLTHVGYDIRIGENVILFTYSKEVSLSEGKSITIEPNERFAIVSLEEILLPDDMFAFIFTRIKLAWKGLTSLGTKVDPMFQDKLVLIFSNDSSQPIELSYKERICNIMFFKYEKPVENIKPRGRPSFLVIPPFQSPIRDPIIEEDVRRKYGYGIYSVIEYLKPKLNNYEDRLKALERMRTWLYATIGSGIIVGIILLLLKAVFNVI
ncbi:MAG: hypothetical protein H3Z53_10340 [archaeon]|nr:hypothetical protein [archaeon]